MIKSLKMGDLISPSFSIKLQVMLILLPWLLILFEFQVTLVQLIELLTLLLPLRQFRFKLYFLVLGQMDQINSFMVYLFQCTFFSIFLPQFLLFNLFNLLSVKDLLIIRQYFYYLQFQILKIYHLLLFLLHFQYSFHHFCFYLMFLVY